MTALLQNIECRTGHLPHLDKTGDFVSLLQDEEDRLTSILDSAVYNGFGATVRIDGKSHVLGQLLYDAIDMQGAPDGAEVMQELISSAFDHNPQAMKLVNKLIAAWAKANAEVSE